MSAPAAPVTPPPSPPPAAYAAPTAPATRPTGVTILAVLAAIGAFFALIGGFGLMALGGLGVAADAGILAAAAGLFGALLLVLALVYAAAAYGLWTRKRWGWYMAAIAAGLGILFDLVELASGEIFGALVGLAINGFLIWYLMSPTIQNWFGVRHNTPWKYKDSAGL